RTPEGVKIRSFAPGDEDGWLSVNNAAFDWHPEQGSQTRADIDAIVTADDFDPESVVIAERDGESIGFPQIKRTDTQTEGRLGEVYVVGVDPHVHAKGVGRALTVEGMRRMLAAGARVVELYVESDNAPALNLYERLGFHVAVAHVCYAPVTTSGKDEAFVTHSSSRRTTCATGTGRPLPRPGAQLAGIQRTRPRPRLGPADPAARAGAVPVDLRDQPRRVLHGPRRRAQAPHQHRPGRAQRDRPDARGGHACHRRPRPRADEPARGSAQGRHRPAPRCGVDLEGRRRRAQRGRTGTGRRILLRPRLPRPHPAGRRPGPPVPLHLGPLAQ